MERTPPKETLQVSSNIINEILIDQFHNVSKNEGELALDSNRPLNGIKSFKVNPRQNFENG